MLPVRSGAQGVWEPLEASDFLILAIMKKILRRHIRYIDHSAALCHALVRLSTSFADVAGWDRVLSRTRRMFETGRFIGSDRGLVL